MCSAAEDVLFPFAACEKDVVFDFFMVLCCEFASEDWVAEAGLVADTGSEGNVGVVEIGRAPGEGPGVEGHEEDGEAVSFCTVEEL